jgi:triphosphoribosyl-dephospho-CoA synthase
MLSSIQVERAFLAACRAELSALKPGNVHAHAGGHTMQVADFETSALAAGPAIADPALGVGEKILRAASATRDAVGCNTNLGIILLCAPLAKAAERCSPPPCGEGLGVGGFAREEVGEIPTPVIDPQSPLAGHTRKGRSEELRSCLSNVLATLTVADAEAAFRAIALMNPAGLGRAPEGDVAAPATITLREAMALAAGRDRIARAYVTDFEEVFDFALPELRRAEALAARSDLAVTTLHMALLARFPDSHIARKHGTAAAEAVRAQAAALRPSYSPVATAKSVAGLLAFDGDLKARGLNPGTTADIVVATLFTSLIETEFAASAGP